MRYLSSRPVLLTALSLLALLLPRIAAAQTSNPAILPYRAIEQQQIRANVNIIVDHSAFMSRDMAGKIPTMLDAQGVPTATGLVENTDGYWMCSKPGAGCLGGKNRWVYVGPSRMAAVKSLLGNSVSLIDFSATPGPSACVAGTAALPCGAMPAAPTAALNAVASQDAIYKLAVQDGRFNPGLVAYPETGNYLPPPFAEIR